MTNLGSVMRAVVSSLDMGRIPAGRRRGVHLHSIHLTHLKECEVGLEPATGPDILVLEGIRDLFVLGLLLMPKQLQEKLSTTRPSGPRRCCSSSICSWDVVPQSQATFSVSSTWVCREPRFTGSLPPSRHRAEWAHGLGIAEE